jgi:putative acetyltransferase
LETAAFGRSDEGRLVDQLRADGDVSVELVVELGGDLLAHIVFSRLRTQAEGPVSAVALAPLAVRPQDQKRGYGSALVLGGLLACAKAGAAAVFVLGDPAYYRRFGFRSRLAQPVSAPVSGPAFMALDLEAGATSRIRRVDYPAAFGLDVGQQETRETRYG